MDGVGGGLLAFDGGKRVGEGGLQGVEVGGGLRCGFDELRAFFGFGGWFGCEGEGAVGG